MESAMNLFSGKKALKAGAILMICIIIGMVAVQAVTSTTTTYPRRRYFDLSYAPEGPVAGGECVKLTITDRATGDEVEDAEVDVYLDDKKAFYGRTGDDGVFEFCPTEKGTYEITIDKSRYKQYVESISVAESIVPTTPEEVVTTPEPTPEVTTPEETPEATPEETTPEPTPEVTTPEPTPEVTTPEETPEETPVVTTTIPPEQPTGGMDMTTLLIIIIVIVIIVVVLYMVTQKKEKGEGKGGKKK